MLAIPAWSHFSIDVGPLRVAQSKIGAAPYHTEVWTVEATITYLMATEGGPSPGPPGPGPHVHLPRVLDATLNVFAGGAQVCNAAVQIPDFREGQAARPFKFQMMYRPTTEPAPLPGKIGTLKGIPYTVQVTAFGGSLQKSATFMFKPGGTAHCVKPG